MGYFKIENAEAQERIESLIKRVKAEILGSLTDRVVAIILIGGLARGEGVWKKVNGQVRVISDADLLVSTKVGARIPNELEARLKNIEDQTGIVIAPRIRSNIEWRFSPRNTELFDIQENGTTIYGRKEDLNLPKVDQSELNFKDTVYLFFNRVYLSIEECSPDDFNSSDEDALQRLSYMAAQTMFTCADFIAIHCHNYLPSVFDRVSFAESKLNELDINIDKGAFLSDLHRALDFKFNWTDKPYLEDARDFWLKAKSHLLALFTFLFVQEYGVADISKYAYFQYKLSPLTGRLRNMISRLRRLARLVKNRKLANFTAIPDLQHHCRLAGLMLYMALSENLTVEYITRAEEYLLKVYRYRNEMMDARDSWLTLRNELKNFRKLGIT